MGEDVVKKYPILIQIPRRKGFSRLLPGIRSTALIPLFTPQAFGFLSAPHQWVSRQCNMDKVLVCERGDLLFVFNFHPTNSYTDYRVGCKLPVDYKVRDSLPWTSRYEGQGVDNNHC